MNKQRIGAFGGTFDPIHNGHLEVARQVVLRFGLDRLLIIPAHKPPHKTMKAITDSYHRYAMSVLATLEDDRLAVSTVELEAPDKPYTYETIERLSSNYGEDAQLFFIMGADSFREVDTWMEPERVLKTANWIVVTRPQHEISTEHLPKSLADRIVDLRGGIQIGPQLDRNCCFTYLTDCVNQETSSTRIREMVGRSESIEGLVPGAVITYIERYGLYRQ